MRNIDGCAVVHRPVLVGACDLGHVTVVFHVSVREHSVCLSIV